MSVFEMAEKIGWRINMKKKRSFKLYVSLIYFNSGVLLMRIDIISVAQMNQSEKRFIFL